MTIRVVLADDHPIVRQGLSALLRSVEGIDVVGVAADGKEALRAAVTLKPDVLIMDIQMPNLDGVAATREITKAAPTVGILVLTMLEDDESVRAAVRAGAAGYVLKGDSQQQIVRAIHARRRWRRHPGFRRRQTRPQSRHRPQQHSTQPVRKPHRPGTANPEPARRRPAHHDHRHPPRTSHQDREQQPLRHLH